ncbi:MAG TPA: hypothetical protein VEV39_07865 [Gemmatimonadales bacterium]|nr:hypothetical protein [Gemmatimonadales bacterium]
MNVLLWILQTVLALYNVMGGFWTFRMAPKLGAASVNPVSAPGWKTLGALQILFGIGLVLPGAVGVMTGLTAIAAICLAVEMVVNARLVASKSFLSVPMLWALIPALACLFVAYGRLVLRPF